MNPLRNSLARRRHPRDRSRTLKVRLEGLEDRTVLSTTTILPSLSAYLSTLTTSSNSTSLTPQVTNTTPSSTAVSPSALIAAYGFSTVPTAGLGTSIAIVGAFDNPTIQADLAAFSNYYHLAPASLTVVNQNGSTTSLPQADAGWSMETAMDVEWAHAVAPGARIYLVEANSASVSDLMTAVQTGARLANVVSMSWGGGEWSGQTTYDASAYFANPNVTFVAASGDDGGAYGAEWPASSPYVVSVGGTTLSRSGIETAWNASGSYWSGYSGSTGGVSQYEPLPTYQAAALGSSAATGRVVPDVASDANPSTGVAIYSTASGLSQTGWLQVGGTSAGAPVWAGLIAGADGTRFVAGKTALSSSQTLSMLYGLYGTPSSRAASYAWYFTDVTSGGNFAGSARSGYDIVTGLGSPKASALWGAAAAYNGLSTSVTTTASNPYRYYVVARSVVHAQPVDDADTTVATVQDSTSSATAAQVAAAAASTAATTPAAQPTTTPSTAIAPVVSLGATATAAPPNQPLTANVAWTPTTPAIDIEPQATQSLPPTSTPAAAVDQALPPADAEPTPSAPAPAQTPGDAAPAVDPGEEATLWDEALAGVRVSRPAPADFDGRAVREDDDDLAGNAPRLAATIGVVAVLWHARRGKADDRRRFAIPMPSMN